MVSVLRLLTFYTAGGTLTLYTAGEWTQGRWTVNLDARVQRFLSLSFPTEVTRI